MYVYLNVYIFKCIYIYLNVYIYIYKCIYIYINMYIYICKCTYICIYMYIYIYYTESKVYIYLVVIAFYDISCCRGNGPPLRIWAFLEASTEAVGEATAPGHKRALNHGDMMAIYGGYIGAHHIHIQSYSRYLYIYISIHIYVCIGLCSQPASKTLFWYSLGSNEIIWRLNHQKGRFNVYFIGILREWYN